MRWLSGTVSSILRFLGLALAHGSYSRPGSIRGGVFTEGTNGKPAVLPRAQIVFRGPVTGEIESDTQGAFAIEGRTPRTYQIDGRSVLSVWEQDLKCANKICELPDSFEGDPEVFLTEDDRKWLKAMDCAFAERWNHA